MTPKQIRNILTSIIGEPPEGGGMTSNLTNLNPIEPLYKATGPNFEIFFSECASFSLRQISPACKRLPFEVNTSQSPLSAKIPDDLLTIWVWRNGDYLKSQMSKTLSWRHKPLPRKPSMLFPSFVKACKCPWNCYGEGTFTFQSSISSIHILIMNNHVRE